MIEKAVFDTGPLIHLNQIESLELLDLFDLILVTEEVADEFGKKLPENTETVRLEPEAKDHTKYLADKHGIEMGEASSIALCSQEKIKLIFTDDLEARQVAKQLEFEPHGTLAIVSRAYTENLIDQKEAEQTVEKLYKDSSLFITRDLVNWTLDKIQEN